MPFRPSLSLLALALLLAGCASDRPKEDVARLIREGRYGEAVQVAAQRVEEDPGDPRAVALHRAATVAFILDAGRQAAFEHHYEDALDSFNSALALDPENAAVQTWIVKTRD